MKQLTLLASLLIIAQVGFAKKFTIQSPDRKINATIEVDKNITYGIAFKDSNYLLPSVISMSLADGRVLGQDPVIRKSSYHTVFNHLHPLYGISREIDEHYNELRIDFKGGYAIVFRAYNEGFAWRFVTDLPGEITVDAERSDFRFAGNYAAYFHPALSESLYRLQKVSDFQLKPDYSSLPVLIKTPGGANILIHESDVFNYPCLTVAADSLHTNTLTGNHSLYPKRVVPGGHMNFNLVVKENENFIARTTGKRNFPWRLIAFAEQDKDILNNQLVYLLASESKIPDASWIKPGKVAWDWWNALNLSGVPFKTGFNTDTYKYYIDFAAANGIAYVNLDEGWSDQFDLLKVSDKIDMQELVRYAKQKNVGLVLWCVWWTLDKQMEAALQQFEKWGIAGLKVDFMDRDDQVVVEFQERLLKEAAKRKMLVNYHGAYHPTGMARTWPNNINVEGVRGLEWNKFNEEGTTPGHAVTIPFIRMFAGSMDYTPGAMNNYNQKDWRQVFDRPTSQGTRCQQLAMNVVYFAPLEMLADAPTAYEKEPEYLQFLSRIPTVWDTTVPLNSKVAEYVTLARHTGDSWYLGAMTSWTPRKLRIPLDFLEPGKKYEAEIYADGINADKVGSDYTRTKREVSSNDSLTADMAPGGGYVVKFTPKGRSPYNIVMFGNSITAHGKWSQVLHRNDVKNSGTPGFTTSHFVWIIQQEVLQYHPKICFLEGGINDIGAGIPLARIYRNYQSLVDTLLAHKIEPVLQSTMYVNHPDEAVNIADNAMVDSLDIYLQELAKSRKLTYIDLNKHFSANKRLKKEYTVDGVHVIQDAYKIWAKEVEAVLKERGL